MGLIHLYCGDGKGKTTAAMGAALRAAGHGKKVLIARFLKTDVSGEVQAFSQVKGVTVLSCEETFGFSWNMTPGQRSRATAYYSELLDTAWKLAAQEQVDMLVLDEIAAACSLHFVEEAHLLKLLADRPQRLEVILTGRGPSAAMVDCADYMTEMVLRRHPYEKGIGAREGIEY